MTDCLICAMCRKPLIQSSDHCELSLITKGNIDESCAIKWMGLIVCSDCLLKITTFIIQNTKEKMEAMKF